MLVQLQSHIALLDRRETLIYQNDTQAQTISHLMAATEAATTPSRNRSAFRRAAITSELVDGRYVARIDEAEYNARMADLFPGELHQN
ncbi:MAG: hypothetical protein EZS28_021119 [Streblomastix strix]|uniref:Uncharacterized protein n=1 Tax=Streblomastix strix TaxID=222440 RepID=A0A5J4VLG9_9EUKA|nr:MAG: hypothetical protein EZS28_021119 [Streblomastix strix]